MLKKLLYILLLLFTSNHLFSQEVSTKQITLVTKVTADWCSKCGTYGWEFTKQLNAKTANLDVISWNAHSSGGLATPTSIEISKNLGGAGQPLFFLDTDQLDLEVTSSNITDKVNEVLDVIDLNTFFGALIGVGGEANLTNGNKINVKGKIKFFDEADAGEYYLAFYTVKKNLVAYQQNVGNNAIHHSILDKSLTSSPWGTKIAAAPIAKNMEFTASAELNNLVLHNGKLEDTKIFAILWNKKSDGKYGYVNGTQINIQDQISSVNQADINSLDATARYQNEQIIISSKYDLSLSSIHLYDIKGNNIPVSMNNVKDQQINIDARSLADGIYLIKLSNDKTSKTIKVSISK